MHDSMYKVYTLIILAFLFSSLKTIFIELEFNVLQGVSHLIMNWILYFFIYWISFEYLWLFWSDQYAPAWLEWATEMTISIGYIHMFFFIMFYMVSEKTISDSEFLVKQSTSLIQFPISLIKYVTYATTLRTAVMVVVALVASAATLITAGVEWLLWKAYIIAII